MFNIWGGFSLFDIIMTVILFALPAFFILIAIELYWDWRKRTGHYRINDAVTSLSAGVLSRIVAIGHQLIPFTAYVIAFEYVSFTELSNAWWVWIVAFVAYDFFYYWNHRMGHEVSILWAAHVVHHSSEDYNLTTALRQTSGALFSWIFYLPLAVAGFPPEMIITVGALNLVYQFWVHTQHIDTLGWMEKVFVTPSNHRVHHAQNRVYIDKNYGGVFILWDRLFGTFIPELSNEKPVFGIRGALKSFNPLMANIQVYSRLARDSYYTSRWTDKCRVWFGRTGWRPADVAERFPEEKLPMSEFEKYDPKLSKAVKKYSVFQHAVMLAITVFLLLNIETLQGIHVLVLALTVITSSIQNGIVLSGSKLALALEGPRLLVFPLLWFAVGLSDLALIYGAVSFVSLMLLVSVIRSGYERNRYYTDIKQSSNSQATTEL